MLKNWEKLKYVILTALSPPCLKLYKRLCMLCYKKKTVKTNHMYHVYSRIP